MGIIDRCAPSGQEVYVALQKAPLVALREMLTDGRILEACRACRHAFRERQYGPVATVLHFLGQALDREGSFAATWQEMWTPLLAEFPEMRVTHFNPSALTHARGRMPAAVMEKLAHGACADAGEELPSRWKGLRLVALDAIAAHEIDVRPGRLEPRALARVTRPYPLLRTSRTRWRRLRLRRAG